MRKGCRKHWEKTRFEGQLYNKQKKGENEEKPSDSGIEKGSIQHNEHLSVKAMTIFIL